jgi:hypothetical protein
MTLPAVVGELVAEMRQRAELQPYNDMATLALQWADRLSALTAEAGKGEREIEVLRHERDHARGCYDRAVKILAGIHAVIYPAIVKLADGRAFAFNSPLLHEQMQALSDRIRAIPDELALSTATPAGESKGYYIATFKQRAHNGEILWWGPDNRGYTPDLKRAGIYATPSPGYHDNEHTVPVPVSFVEGLRVRHIVDPGDEMNGCMWSAEKLRQALAASPRGASAGGE